MLASYITELTLSISTAQRADTSAVTTDTSELLVTAPAVWRRAYFFLFALVRVKWQEGVSINSLYPG